MGCPDTLVSDCPNCGKTNAVQTKMFFNDLRKINEGDNVSGETNLTLGLKYDCVGCKGRLAALIKGGEFWGFVTMGDPTLVELPFGDSFVPETSNWVIERNSKSKEIYRALIEENRHIAGPSLCSCSRCYHHRNTIDIH